MRCTSTPLGGSTGGRVSHPARQAPYLVVVQERVRHGDIVGSFQVQTRAQSSGSVTADGGGGDVRPVGWAHSDHIMIYSS
jgi:hypothetical protein